MMSRQRRQRSFQLPILCHRSGLAVQRVNLFFLIIMLRNKIALVLINHTLNLYLYKIENLFM